MPTGSATARGRPAAESPATSDRSSSRRTGQVVDPPGQFDVVRRHAAGAVRRNGEAHGAPADVDVGMMVHLLRDISDGANKLDGSRKRRALDGALNAVGVTGPTVKSGELLIH